MHRGGLEPLSHPAQPGRLCGHGGPTATPAGPWEPTPGGHGPLPARLPVRMCGRHTPSPGIAGAGELVGGARRHQCLRVWVPHQDGLPGPSHSAGASARPCWHAASRLALSLACPGDRARQLAQGRHLRMEGGGGRAAQALGPPPTLPCPRGGHWWVPCSTHRCCALRAEGHGRSAKGVPRASSPPAPPQRLLDPHPVHQWEVSIHVCASVTGQKARDSNLPRKTEKAKATERPPQVLQRRGTGLAGHAPERRGSDPIFLGGFYQGGRLGCRRQQRREEAGTPAAGLGASDGRTPPWAGTLRSADLHPSTPPLTRIGRGGRRGGQQSRTEKARAKGKQSPLQATATPGGQATRDPAPTSAAASPPARSQDPRDNDQMTKRARPTRP